MVNRIGQVLLIIGILITLVSLVVGFGYMFAGTNNELAKFCFMVVPLGFLITFLGLSTVVLLSPRGSDK